MERRVSEAQIRRAAQKAGIPYSLFYAVVGQEAGGRHRLPSGKLVTSPAGAEGAAQLMPGTARALEQRYPGLNTRTAYGNLLGGAYYLAEQKKRFGNWKLALAAYNAGPGRVKEYGNTVPPIPETQRYVRNILAKAGVGKLNGSRKARTAAPAPEQFAPEGGGGTPTVAPSLTPADVDLQGLRDLAEGDYNPTRQLQGLVGADEAAEAAAEATAALRASQPQPRPLETADAWPQGKPPRVKGGITYDGRSPTHQTSGLAGHPARDVFAKPGTPFRAPEPGVVFRHSGTRGDTEGGVYGESVYFRGQSGRVYFITHITNPAKLGRYQKGAVLGLVSPWSGGSPHAHAGVREPRKGRK